MNFHSQRHFLNELSFKKKFLWRHSIFSWLIRGLLFLGEMCLKSLDVRSRTFSRATQNFLFLSLYILYALRRPFFLD